MKPETEAVELCPHCMAENTYPDWDVQKQGYIAECQTCGRQIALCDECMHADDNPKRTCDWHEEISTPGQIIGVCKRGVTVEPAGKSVKNENSEEETGMPENNENKAIALSEKDFKKICKETLPHLEALQEIVKSAGLLTGTTELVFSLDGYARLSIYNTGWEMTKTSGTAMARIRHEIPLEL